MTDLLARARAAGILPSFKDTTGVIRDTSETTAAALLAAMGDDVDLPRDVICEVGVPPDLRIKGRWTLVFEDGQEQLGTGPLPALPLGIHTLTSGKARFTLLSAPASLPLPAPCWGVIAPLYGLSETGIGSYDDLIDLATGLGPLGCAFLGINPVHAGFPSDPGAFSPYTPSHRRRLNVMHLPGGHGGSGRLVNYASDTPARMATLRAQYSAFAGDPGFDAYLAEEGAPLERFALYQALSEIHGPFWNAWPDALHHPDAPAVADAAAALSAEVRFHAWLQWRADCALAETQALAKASGMTHGLYLDLAVGTHPYGAETWEDRDSFAFGASLGSPPDAFSADGQNWCLAPFNPRALRARAYAPLVETLRRQLRVAGVLRIDHILGFERAFWVPDGAPGAYVQMPRDAMLAVVRIEATRAGAIVVGEDLGNIPDGLRAALEESGILGCRVAMFERASWHPPVFRAAQDYDAAAIASFSTHDLPTWTGWRKGLDIDARQDTGSIDADQATAEHTLRQAEVSALDARLEAPTDDALHAFLARTPSRLLGLQAEILLGMDDQPNLPGTTTQYPNWRLRLPVPAKSISCHDSVIRTAQMMRDHDRDRRGQ